MFKLPKSKVPTPISLSEYRVFFFCELMIFSFVFGLAFLIHSLGGMSSSEISWIILIVVILNSFVFAHPQVQRLRDLYPEKKISPFAVAGYSIFPFLNVPLILVCFFKEAGPRQSAVIPFLARKRIAMPFFLFMTVQTSFFGFGIYPAKGIYFHAWMSNPSSQKLAYVATQARIVMEIKKAHAGKDDLMEAFERAQQEIPFDSTGRILSVAVVATDAFKKKEKLKTRSPSSYKKEASLLILKNLIQVERIQEKQKGMWIGFSPLAILSPANLIEIALLSLVDEKIERSYKVKMKSKLEELTVKFEEIGKKNNDVAYLKKLAEYKAEIKKF